MSKGFGDTKPKHQIEPKVTGRLEEFLINREKGAWMLIEKLRKKHHKIQFSPLNWRSKDPTPECSTIPVYNREAVAK